MPDGRTYAPSTATAIGIDWDVLSQVETFAKERFPVGTVSVHVLDEDGNINASSVAEARSLVAAGAKVINVSLTVLVGGQIAVSCHLWESMTGSVQFHSKNEQEARGLKAIFDRQLEVGTPPPGPRVGPTEFAPVPPRATTTPMVRWRDHLSDESVAGDVDDGSRGRHAQPEKARWKRVLNHPWTIAVVGAIIAGVIVGAILYAIFGP